MCLLATADLKLALVVQASLLGAAWLALVEAFFREEGVALNFDQTLRRARSFFEFECSNIVGDYLCLS